MDRVVIAPDGFKGTLSATAVAAALADGLRSAGVADVVEMPMADGGEGSLTALLSAGFELASHGVYAQRGDVAVVELARLDGLMRQGRAALLDGLARLDGMTASTSTPRPNDTPDESSADASPDSRSNGSGQEATAMTAGTWNTGRAVAAAIRAGCTKVWVALGGSASTDGGLGFLRALGAVVHSHAGEVVGTGGAALGEVAHIDVAPALRLLRGVDLVALVDVDNPLTGDQGAARVYGPQKGASPGETLWLDQMLTRWADLVAAAVGRDVRAVPGAGAAGGVGFAIAALGGTVASGASFIVDAVGLPVALPGTDLLITGEGKLDEQTLRGKTALAVARAGAAQEVPVLAVAGTCTLNSAQWKAAGFADVRTLTSTVTVTEALAHPAALLTQLGRAIGGERVT